jgi:RimJ/RimL family protein N-acetyltransferase
MDASSARLAAAGFRLRRPEDPCTLSLRDGTELVVRPLRPRERHVVEAVFAGLGEESRRRRFGIAIPRLRPREIDRLSDVDDAHVALVAEAGGRPIAIARFFREGDDAAELALEVVDAWHGRGVGGALIELLGTRARQAGVRTLRATVRSDNRAMLTLLRRLGRLTVEGWAGAELTVAVAL